MADDGPHHVRSAEAGHHRSRLHHYNEITTYDIRGISGDAWRWQNANRGVLWGREWDVGAGERWWRFAIDIVEMRLTASSLGDIAPQGDFQTDSCEHIR